MITDHLFRLPGDGNPDRPRTGRGGTPRVDPGMCAYLGRCNQPQDEHITAAEFRPARKPDEPQDEPT